MSTYSHFQSGEVKDLHRRRLLRRVAVELAPAPIPFHGVQAVVLDVVEAFEDGFVAALDRVRHSHPDIPQSGGQA